MFFVYQDSPFLSYQFLILSVPEFDIEHVCSNLDSFTVLPQANLVKTSFKIAISFCPGANPIQILAP